MLVNHAKGIQDAIKAAGSPCMPSRSKQHSPHKLPPGAGVGTGAGVAAGAAEAAGAAGGLASARRDRDLELARAVAATGVRVPAAVTAAVVGSAGRRAGPCS